MTSPAAPDRLNTMKCLMTHAALALSLAVVFITASGVGAQTPAAARSDLASAEVIAVYPKEKRVLLKHGPIADLGMSGMTMEFAVAQPRMLASFKRGKKIMFSAIMVNDDYVVTHVEAAR
jgi:Cu(I)/Ag(I) efflux system periplasmic protein CusF